jgi:hypothetical protein
MRRQFKEARVEKLRKLGRSFRGCKSTSEFPHLNTMAAERTA